ncbi:MAG: hypothetical protein Q8P35_02915 [Candidatus Yanofskybacteria bacterium]|nr:hypothetical protein [Candidatus Yanofskybacteria bacterium]
MDIQELKQLLKGSTSVLILDDGQPAFVIVDYKIYRNLVSEKEGDASVSRPGLNFNSRPNPAPALSAQELEVIERLNKEILALKNQIESEERSEFETSE